MKNNIIKQNLQEMLHAIVKKSDIDTKDEMGNTNWSADYQLNKKLGKKPYAFQDYQYVPVANNKELKKAVYLHEEDANQLNILGKGVRDMLQLFESKKQELGI
jgi:hypothetical protein